MGRSLGVLLVVLGLVAGAAPAAAEPGNVVRTESGPVRGTTTDGLRVHQGIPFAAPPVGELRWHAPVAPLPWRGVRDATRPGNRCPQAALPGRPASDAEDCLYLDVTAKKHARKSPVLVWVHGGGLVSGAGSDFDPARLAARGDLVVVTVNYRLGNLGFMSFPGLADGGAFGIEDQQAALRWVTRNIAAFGGDPRNVTVAGESGGAHSVCALLASPRSAGLFQRAIGQSTPCVSDAFAGADFRPLLDLPYFVPHEWQQGHGQNVAARFGCTTLACLRDVPVADLLTAPVFPLPAYGNAVLPEDPAVAVPAGRFQHVPFLTGVTRDEGTLFAPPMFPGLTEEGYRRALSVHFGPKADAVAERYPVTAHGTPLQAIAALMSDLDWAWAQHAADRTFAAEVPVYAYEFLDRTAPAIVEFPAGVEPLASHAAELKFLFDFPYDDRPLTAAQRRLGDRMIDYWARFATTGDPNRPGLPRWHPVDPAGTTPFVQGFDVDRIGPVDRAALHGFAFWDALAAQR
ncbi:carboxylesterase/lipase family protein [Saccharothrix longispora]|uniref:carboxylesterase/lipase family protein n=1 Tax=Saccharothrix longispora TaxID=33920 RepID=UPI0028FD8CC1|nr:carboxylesterase family protein [Saccharothrix longispora]MDU0292214.1 carboxylesterase family protein [Saccharothrix longispora]